jgi:hypothetical protein
LKTFFILAKLLIQDELEWCDKYRNFLSFGNSIKLFFECKLCNINYKDYKALKKHGSTSHRGIMIWILFYCCKTKKIASLEISTGIDPARPTIIDRNIQMFSENDILMLIGANCDTTQGAYFKCKQCARLKFNGYDSFKKHVLKMHKQVTNVPSGKYIYLYWRRFYTKNDIVRLCFH